GVTGHTIATTDDGQSTVVKDFNFSGTYTMNTDGTGTLSIAPTVATADEGPETYAFVLNKGDVNRPSTVDLAETDNTGGGAKIFLTGKATSTTTTTLSVNDISTTTIARLTPATRFAPLFTPPTSSNATNAPTRTA